MICKLGPHVIGGTSVGLGRPAVVKLVNVSAAYVAQVRWQVGADCLIIVRWVLPAQPLDDPVARAQQFVARYQAGMLMMHAVGGPNIAFEGYNEIPDGVAGAYCIFEEERLDQIHALGLRAVVGNFSVGTPDLPVWAPYKPMLQAMGARDLLGLHEYWSDTDDLGNRYHCARWTKVPALRYVPIVVTECGRDYTPDTKRGEPGWKRTCNAETFLGDLRAYDALLCQYDNVLGGVVFTMGNDPRWAMFDPSELWPRVVAETSPLPVTVTPPPAPTPAPPEEDAVKTFYADGRYMNMAEFAQHVESLPERKIVRVVMHHTAKPTLADWHKWGGWVHYKDEFIRYYRDTKGWTVGPHLFVDEGGVGLLTPLTMDGAGAFGFNAGAWHIEVVGDYSKAAPAGATLDNALPVAAILLRKAGLGIEGLTYHKKLTPALTECPGAAWISVWAWFRDLITAALQPAPELPEDLTTTDPAIMAEKARWWTEELERQEAAGNRERAGAIRRSLIKLLYKLETTLKAR